MATALLKEAFFILGFFALLFTAIASSSGEELGFYVKAHPIPLQEAQVNLSLP